MNDDVINLKKSQIKPSGWNPRSEEDKEEFEALRKSIDTLGIRVPLVVGEKGKDGKYPLYAGERRWKASKSDMLIPCVVQKGDVIDAKLTTLVENLVRESVSSADHEKFIEGLFIEGKKSGRWTGRRTMSKKTGIPEWLIQNASLGCKDREQLKLSSDTSKNITTGDLIESRPLAEQPAIRKMLLEKRANQKKGTEKSLLKEEAHVVRHVSKKLEGIPNKIAKKYLDDEISDVALEHARQAIKKGVPVEKIEFETQVNARQRQSLDHMKKSADREMEDRLLKGRERHFIHIGKGADNMHLSKYRNAVEQVRKFSSNEIENMIHDQQSKNEAIECLRYLILACSTILLQMGQSVPYARIDAKSGDIIESEDGT